MNIQDITPELARKFCNAYLEAMIDSGVNKLSHEQNLIVNGLHALEYLESAKADLEKPALSFATVQITDRLEQLESMLQEAEPFLTQHLNSLSI